MISFQHSHKLIFSSIELHAPVLIHYVELIEQVHNKSVLTNVMRINTSNIYLQIFIINVQYVLIRYVNLVNQQQNAVPVF